MKENINVKSSAPLDGEGIIVEIKCSIGFHYSDDLFLEIHVFCKHKKMVVVEAVDRPFIESCFNEVFKDGKLIEFNSVPHLSLCLRLYDNYIRSVCGVPYRTPDLSSKAKSLHKLIINKYEQLKQNK